MESSELNSIKRELTVIIPAYNEEQGIGQTLDMLIPVIKSNNFQLIVVNDGSVDGTENIIKEKGVFLISHPYNKGYGSALKTGIMAANSPYIALYDADGQHNPQDLLNLWNNKENYDMLIGMRGKDSHQEWIRKPGKWVIQKTANFLTGRKIPDLNSGLRIIKRERLIDKMHLFSETFSFSTTSTVAFMSLGYFVDYYPIKVNKRFGKSTIKQLKHGPSTLLLILRMVILYNPLKVFLPVSIIMFIIGILWGVYGYIIFKRFPNSATLLTLMGVLFFFIGLISDQISTLNKK